MEIRKKRMLMGSYTVEASLLFPMVVILCVLIIYLTFFVYDECSLWQSAYIAALRGGTSRAGQEKEEETAGRTVRQLLKEQLLAAEHVEYEAHSDKRTVRVLIGMNLRPPVGKGMTADSWRLESKGEMERLRPVEYIRMCRRLKEAAGWIFDGKDTGYD